MTTHTITHTVTKEQRADIEYVIDYVFNVESYYAPAFERAAVAIQQIASSKFDGDFVARMIRQVSKGYAFNHLTIQRVLNNMIDTGNMDGVV